MAIQFICPKCNQTVTVTDQHAGGQVFCPTCRAELTVPGTAVGSLMPMGQSAGPQPAPSVGGTATLARRPKRSAAAVVSLILSILSWLFCCIGPLLSLPGLICGLVARRRIKRRGGAMTGGGMALLGWGLSFLNLLAYGAMIAVGLGTPTIRNGIMSGYQLVMIHQACIQYTTTNSQMPPDLRTLVDQGLLESSDMLTCPLSGNPYVYTAAGKSLSDLAESTIVAYSTFEIPDRQRLVLFWGNRIQTVKVDELRSRLRDQGVPENLIP